MNLVSLFPTRPKAALNSVLMSRHPEQQDAPTLTAEAVDSVRFSAGKKSIAKPLMFIDGTFQPASTGKTFSVRNPFNQKVLAEVPEASPEDVDKAVRSARTAFESWGQSTPESRATVLRGIATQLRANADMLARLEVANNGKPIGEALADVSDSARHFDKYAEWATLPNGQVHPVPEPNHELTRLRVPRGVAGQIIPWNYPLMMAAWKIAPALAAGNTVVLKTAEQTPLTALKLAELFEQAGVPKGVINIITGAAETGKALASHPDIDILSFTGSSEVGRLIAMSAANREIPIPVILELGGKSPLLVFDDADLPGAVLGGLFGSMINQGQVCTATSRILVQEGVHSDFVSQLSDFVAQLRLGDGMDPTTQMGPLITREHRDKVLAYIRQGMLEATLISGGHISASKKLENGNFVEPTIFADVDPNSRLAQEEIFGPVATVTRFKTEAEGLKLANGTPYGLAASIWTRDAARQHRMQQGIKAGIQWYNTNQPAWAEIAWGGTGKSGMGHDSIEAYQREVNVIKNHGPMFDWYQLPKIDAHL